MKKLFYLIIALSPVFLMAQNITYSNGFEGNQSIFTTDPGSSWERGIPSMTRIDTAHNGVKVWATDLDSNYKNTPTLNNSNLYTQFFKINTINYLAAKLRGIIKVSIVGNKSLYILSLCLVI